MSISQNFYDTVVIGGGIAGQEASLSLAELGYKVLLVEKDVSIGGKMIQLSKVFPTLDCAACITTPKMSETARHSNIKLLLNSDIKEINKENEIFQLSITQRPTYVVADLCIGCGECERVCKDIHSDQYNYDMVDRKSAYIAFSLANPKVAIVDYDNCKKCNLCAKICPSKAIDYSLTAVDYQISAKSVIIATGYKLFSAENKPQYGFGKLKNVIQSMQMDRLIAPTRPYNNVVRPSDGKIPDNVAYVLCAGSRDNSIENIVCNTNDCSNNPICSQICCMYSIKQAQLLMGALPLADITIYYIDIRAFGKGYEEFFQQAKSMGVNFVKAKIAKIIENKDKKGDLILRYEDINTGIVKEAKHDLAVLSVGILPNSGIKEMFKNQDLELDAYNFINQSEILTSPSKTNIDGVFVAGAASSPKDIPDSILSAGCAATEVSSYLKNIKNL